MIGKGVVRLQLALRSAGFAKVPATGKHGAATVRRSQDHPEAAPPQADRGSQRRILESAASRQDHRDNGRRQKAGRKAGPTPQARTKGEKALAHAKKQLGDRYVFGGAGPNGWDAPA